MYTRLGRGKDFYRFYRILFLPHYRGKMQFYRAVKICPTFEGEMAGFWPKFAIERKSDDSVLMGLEKCFSIVDIICCQVPTTHSKTFFEFCFSSLNISPSFGGICTKLFTANLPLYRGKFIFFTVYRGKNILR